MADSRREERVGGRDDEVKPPRKVLGTSSFKLRLCSLAPVAPKLARIPSNDYSVLCGTFQHSNLIWRPFRNWSLRATMSLANGSSIT